MTPSLWIAFGLALVAAVAAGALPGLLQGRRLARRVAAQEARIASLERDLVALCDGTRGMGDALRATEQRLRKVSARQNELDLRSPEQRTYRRAIELVQRGAGVRELVESCGLERSEAELVHLLHARRRARAEPLAS
jgi:hypothetical protein